MDTIRRNTLTQPPNNNNNPQFNPPAINRQ